jgi:penicillin-binding protein 2
MLPSSDKKHQDFKLRIIVAWLLVVVFIGFLVGRLFYLEVVQVEHFTTLSKNNWLKIVPIPPPRGVIFDRHGVPLAENEISYSLEIQPDQAENPQQKRRIKRAERVENLDHLLKRLQELISLSDKEIDRFKKTRKRSQRFKPVILKTQLTKDEVVTISVRNYELIGAKVTPILTRVYPMGKVGAHAIGYVGRINEDEVKNFDETQEAQYDGTQFIGKTGIEKYYEHELHGKVGYQEVETNVSGQTLRVVKQVEPIAGDNLYLNLDIVLQKKAEELFVPKPTEEEKNLGIEPPPEKGALVAIEPATGGILALVSSPGYDPNLFVKGIDTETYQELNDEKERPLYNRAITGLYPPGSTIKPLVGLAGLERELRDMNDKTYCPGWYTLGEHPHKYRDWKREGHGHVTLHDAIEESCDVYFYDLANDLGIDHLSGYLKQFTLGERTGIDMMGEVGGLVPTRAWKRKRHNTPWYPGETLIAGIGQGYMLVTPLQLAVSTATLSMKGEIRLPRMVFMQESKVTNTTKTIPSQATTRVDVKHPEYWDYIISSMEAVVIGKNGTANKLSDDLKYRLAGKTGTAQVVQIKQDQEYDAASLDKSLHDHALFVAFAPIDDPKIAVAVIVENGGSGGRTAAPYAKELIDFYLEDRLDYIYEEIKINHAN